MGRKKRKTEAAAPAVEVLDWQDCYDGNWKGEIVDEAFAHPAKFAYGLISRILDFGLERGYWKPGDLIGDCFGGVALGGIVAAYKGLRWVGVELEPRFHELGNQNIDLHRYKWGKLGAPVPVLLQGDSRHFARIVREHCQAVVTSPPYEHSKPEHWTAADSARYDQMVRDGKASGKTRGKAAATREETHYGAAPGQIGNLKAGDVDAVVTSPPYAGNGEVLGGHNGIDYSKAKSGGRQSSPGRKAAGENYGDSPGQIAELPSGDLDSVITSPPYAGSLDHPPGNKDFGGAGTAKHVGQIHVSGDGYGQAPGQIGALPEGQVDAIVTSPVYAKGGQDGGSDHHPERCEGSGKSISLRDGYGDSPGQIGNLPAGSVDSIIASPPYAESVQGEHGETETAEHTAKARRTQGGSLGKSQRHGGYGSTEGNIGNLKEGAVDAVVTSPPFTQDQPCASQTQAKKDYEAFKGGAKRDQQMRSDGNIAALPPGDVDGVVTSPPYSEGLGHGGGRPIHQPGAPDQVTLQGQKEGYGDAEGQLGISRGETYWQAMRQVYEQCRLALKPSGVICVVLKAYVKNGQIVDLPEQTCKLLEAVGFKVFLRVRAWLVKETRTPDLFGGEIVRRRERKSFFRRLHEKRSPETRIDFEEVIFARRADPVPGLFGEEA